MLVQHQHLGTKHRNPSILEQADARCLRARKNKRMRGCRAQKNPQHTDKPAVGLRSALGTQI
ncbi:hypothetical protein CZ674_07805 [Agrococcus casei LMG 22410]|uniref:Uncharacterized protein n=1 Tax=Agrococcus casei LMG 22410 TaxID=1255656 RepID=A0A1R4G074_9MICO|nr:hypothetical protein CZ674_07805 [Agrococcus casei LMG 22410]